MNNLVEEIRNLTNSVKEKEETAFYENCLKLIRESARQGNTRCTVMFKQGLHINTVGKVMYKLKMKAFQLSSYQLVKYQPQTLFT